MPPKTKEAIQHAITLREAGLTLSVIADKTGISASTLFRAFKKHGIGRGELTNELIEEARQQLLNDAGFIDQLKHTIASSIVDDLSLVRKIREMLTLALEEIGSDSSTPAILKARSLAAFST
jgi:AcrR family transcriptional regulator